MLRTVDNALIGESHDLAYHEAYCINYEAVRLPVLLSSVDFMLLVPSYWSPGGSRSVTESAYGWFGSHRQCATWLLNYSATDIHGCPKMYASMGLQPESFDHSMFYHPFSTKIPSSGSPVHHWPEILVFTAHQSAEVFRHSRFWKVLNCCYWILPQKMSKQGHRAWETSTRRQRLLRSNYSHPSFILLLCLVSTSKSNEWSWISPPGPLSQNWPGQHHRVPASCSWHCSIASRRSLACSAAIKIWESMEARHVLFPFSDRNTSHKELQ